MNVQAALRERVWRLLEVTRDPETGDVEWDVVDVGLLVLVLLNVVAVVIETMPSLAAYERYFVAFDVFSIAVFSVEYLARIWSCVADPRYSRPIAGRLRYATSFYSVVDALAIVPFYAALLTPLALFDLRFLRVLRLARLIRVLKIGRYAEAMDRLGRVFRAKKSDIGVALGAVFVVLIISSSLMYHAENAAQPDIFSSIPAAMWWGITTLTTVGYGDMAPVTVLGKVLAGFIQLLGISLFALPAGIIASGYEQENRRRRAASGVCPECGRPHTVSKS